MKVVKLSMYLVVDDNKRVMDEIERLTHHAENLLDLDGWSDIHSVFGVNVEEIEDYDESEEEEEED